MTAPLGLLEKTSAYLQYLVDRGTHWFPRVNFLIGRFPQQRLNRRDDIHYLWQELIGILGWQDIMLPVWTYVALTVLLVLMSLQTLDVYGALRTRVAIVTAIGLVGYVITVYLIFFLTYTPLDVDHVRGVQGRYFVIALPMAAIFIAATINVALPRGLIATMALTGSLISGIASFQALLEAHWSVP